MAPGGPTNDRAHINVLAPSGEFAKYMLDPAIVCHGLGRAPVPLLSRRFRWAWAAGIRRPRTPWLRGRVRALRLRERPGLVASFSPVPTKSDCRNLSRGPRRLPPSLPESGGRPA